MKCEICNNNEAIVHVQQIIGNEEINVHICEKCAFEKGISNNPSDALDVSLKDLVAGLVDLSILKRRKDVSTCPGCETSIKNIRKKGALGCPQCYSVFQKEISRLVEEECEDTQYTGRLPVNIENQKKLLENQTNLQHDLEAAIANEDYEKAAMIRDQLSKLEQKREQFL